MEKEQITAIFDEPAATYDQKWSRLAPINSALHLLTSAVLSDLPATARILCVGAGTGAEILHLAQKFPGWHFTAVEPSVAMLNVLRQRAEENGISARCAFHAGYLDTLAPGTPFDAATAFLVSQFILDTQARSEFFKSIAERLQPEGMLVSSDLSGDLSGGADSMGLLDVWFRTMRDGGSLAVPEEVEKMREAYRHDVAVLSPAKTRDIISNGGFGPPVQFFQAGMIHAWYAKRINSTPVSINLR